MGTSDQLKASTALIPRNGLLVSTGWKVPRAPVSFLSVSAEMRNLILPGGKTPSFSPQKCTLLSYAGQLMRW
jgi:hypothetical protein